MQKMIEEEDIIQKEFLEMQKNSEEFFQSSLMDMRNKSEEFKKRSTSKRKDT